ncbi:MAG: hypothetical protein JRM86_05195 [Nitrososphaerota archaeon]|jgi:hypothetical protein|nr:hypothetical protein [Nitrososphaerota archaeon]MDG6966406.1 hypothetical protein [Nitrososphaerota archaeon]MDG6979098.1 hypothetical protein [Nitrososphaerota archaeon]MDG7006311.1 hypothetical protein [Nitrososphaerota archaeon]MDG7020547.1 hypothetical protein [Nitrososphaerota archaeon]
MESTYVERDSASGADARFHVMRALAKLHECTAETLRGGVDASELDVDEVIGRMVSSGEVEASSGPEGGETFALTAKGWLEYMKVLGSLYELP